MPIIKFTDNDGTAWELPLPMGDNGLPRLHLAEVRHIQRVTDMGVKDVTEKAFVELDGTAITAIVQVLWKRQGRVVKFDDVDFDIGQHGVRPAPRGGGRGRRHRGRRVRCGGRWCGPYDGVQWGRDRGGLTGQLHNYAPDLWARYGLPWDRLDALWWDEFADMTLVIDEERRQRRKQQQREVD